MINYIMIAGQQGNMTGIAALAAAVGDLKNSLSSDLHSYCGLHYGYDLRRSNY